MDPNADIVASIEGAAAVVRLNRPEKLNAFTIDMVDGLRDVVLDGRRRRSRPRRRDHGQRAGLLCRPRHRRADGGGGREGTPP